MQRRLLTLGREHRIEGRAPNVAGDVLVTKLDENGKPMAGYEPVK